MKKKIPEYKSEAEELQFWSIADSTEYFDWAKAKKTQFVTLKPTPVENLKGKELRG